MTQGGKSGCVEIPWITNSTVYEVRLYPVSRLNVAIDSVKHGVRSNQRRRPREIAGKSRKYRHESALAIPLSGDTDLP